MSNTYTKFAINVPCTPEQSIWLENVLNYLRTLVDSEDDCAELTEKEKDLLGAEHLHEDFRELKELVVNGGGSCDYYALGSADGFDLFLDSEEAGDPDYALLALALLTGKYPERFPEPLHFEWACYGDKSGGSGGFAQVYKGYIDKATLTSDFKEEIDATLTGDRLHKRFTSMGALHPRGASQARAKALELLSKHIDAAHQQLLDLDFKEQLYILLSEGEYTEEALLALLLGSKAN